MMDEVKNFLQSDFEFPEGLKRIVKQNLMDLEPWYILNSNEIENKLKGLKKRYPQRALLPFAVRGDNDDVACFEYEKNNEEVYVIHDYASPGWEQRGHYNTFWEWFKTAIDDMINF